MVATRIRRTPEESRRAILQAAEELLVEGGLDAVTVRAVAKRIGMTDAGVAHHFGSRQDLLVALLRYGGRRIRGAVEEAVAGWADRQADIDGLIRTIARVYDQGYAELAVALHAAGWEDPGTGFLEPVVQILHTTRARSGRPGPLADTRLAVAALHQALALDATYGAAFRRSAGVSESAALRPGPQRAWWANTLRTALGLPSD
ncbi:TetR family transcriptional regulator [Kribbella albertanoniae]|uniref:TetR/AcrR family transcriptional regulator n=1 Tax=Kribbella albertanoniae TaxID=1266829 RepID=UPI00192D64A2|nr:TetR/AcrR family transcriptional regulator [Kribbella albertanoniae]